MHKIEGKEKCKLRKLQLEYLVLSWTETCYATRHTTTTKSSNMRLKKEQ